MRLAIFATAVMLASPAMADNFYGGFADGLNQAREHRLQERELDLLERQIEQAPRSYRPSLRDDTFQRRMDRHRQREIENQLMENNRILRQLEQQRLSDRIRSYQGGRSLD